MKLMKRVGRLLRSEQMSTPNVSEQLRVFRKHIDSDSAQNQWKNTDIVLAGVPIRIRSSDVELMKNFTLPFAQFSEVKETPRQTIHLVSLLWLRAQGITPQWQWEFDTYSDLGGHISFDRVFGAMTAFDFENESYLIALEHLDESGWLRPERSRPLIEKLMSPHGFVSLHGGTIGRGSSGVLLSARGGSGKSSLVAAAIRRGLNTTGDDFLLLEREDDRVPAKIWSLYRWIKLALSSPAWIDSLGDFDEVDNTVVGEKSILSFERIYPEAFTRYQIPSAVIVPRLGDSARLVQIDPLEALAAVLPSSVGMSSRKVEATIQLKGFVESLPCYSLEIGENLDQALDLVEPLFQ
jgi:hypothetical protein